MTRCSGCHKPINGGEPIIKIIEKKLYAPYKDNDKIDFWHKDCWVL